MNINTYHIRLNSFPILRTAFIYVPSLLKRKGKKSADAFIFHTKYVSLKFTEMRMQLLINFPFLITLLKYVILYVQDCHSNQNA